LLGVIYTSEAAERAAATIIDSYSRNGTYESAAVRFLCEMSAAEDPAIAHAGLKAIFVGLVERLNDSFDPLFCELYDRSFAQIIDFYRHLPAALAIDNELNRFLLKTDSDLLARKRQIQSNRPLNASDKQSIRRVIFLSRVTLGADVAITSVILQRARQALPQAEAVLLGSRKLNDLFGGDPKVRVHEVRYERGAGVVDRLNGWLAVVRAIEEEARGLDAGAIWVVDPDSRLTQLGLLPVCPADHIYSLFESRGFGSGQPTSLSRLASLWSEEILQAGSEELFPSVSLPKVHLQFGREVTRRLRRGGKPYIISLSFGVGGNELKRHGDEFEEGLLAQLLREATVILDKGASASEHEQVNRMVARSQKVLELREGELPEEDEREIDLVTFDGGIGAFAGLIAASDEYVGYDSAGQHIAAALSVPAITIFVNGNSERFAERWRPGGRGLIEVLLIDAKNRGSATQTLEEVMALHKRLRSRTGK
jgi:ADP-heptose:LPS heptosyltransferase